MPYRRLPPTPPVNSGRARSRLSVRDQAWGRAREQATPEPGELLLHLARRGEWGLPSH